MFVCPKHKILFLAIPKTATRSIYYVLQTQYGGRKWKEHHPNIPKQFKDYFSFCVVRNPYDRACSAYWSLCKRKGDRNGYQARLKHNGLENTFDNFMLLFRGVYENKRHAYPQHYFIEGNNIDQILRYETLQEDFNTLPFLKNPVELPRSNSTTENKTKATTAARPHWEDMLTPKGGQIVNEIYKKDFELLNYPMRSFEC